MITAVLAVILGALPARAADPPKGDTAGVFLYKVLSAARSQYPDAVLLSIDAKTSVKGTAVCSKNTIFTDGWRFHLYSPRTETFILVGRCGESVVGPMREIRSVPDLDLKKMAVIGKFADTHEALEVLRKKGVDLDAAGGGKRPLTMRMYRSQDIPKEPVVWEVQVGSRKHVVSALERQLLDQAALSKLAAKDAGRKPARPAEKGYTARADMQKARAYAKSRFPGAVLMGITGVVDAAGALTCAQPADGWAYHFYDRKKNAVVVVRACRGKTALGESLFSPVDQLRHETLEADFIDSDKAVEGLLRSEKKLAGGLRTATMRLLHYQNPPQSLSKLRFLWEIELGNRVFYVDAKSGRYAAEFNKF